MPRRQGGGSRTGAAAGTAARGNTGLNFVYADPEMECLVYLLCWTVLCALYFSRVLYGDVMLLSHYVHEYINLS